MDNTLLIIYSDHPILYNVRWRIPLMMHFPNDEFSGTIRTNVQNLDIPPTILDYLGIDQPEWMQGQSLLQENSPDNELIFSTGTVLTTRNEQKIWVVDSASVKPPFYQFSFFNIVNCHKWYELDFTSLTWNSGDVPEHTMPCSDEQLLTQDQIHEALLEHLSTNGFDISTICTPKRPLSHPSSGSHNAAVQFFIAKLGLANPRGKPYGSANQRPEVLHPGCMRLPGSSQSALLFR